MRPAALIAVALTLPGLASAWDTKKFNARALEKEWGIPCYVKGGGVVGNEVMVNDEERTKSAEWALKKADVKAVADFYQAKLKLEPKASTTDTGDEVFTFTFPFDKTKRTQRKVYVKRDNNDRLVHVRFAEKKYLEGEDEPAAE